MEDAFQPYEIQDEFLKIIEKTNVSRCGVENGLPDLNLFLTLRRIEPGHPERAGRRRSRTNGPEEAEGIPSVTAWRYGI